MENASKALIIAGAILIAIMIVSLYVLIFTNFSSTVRNNGDLDEQEIAAFNSNITPYTGRSVSGSQVNALIQKVISINYSAISENDPKKSIAITYPINEGPSPTKITIQVNSAGNAIENIDETKRVPTGPNNYYKVTYEYGTTGLINKVNVVAQ